MKTFIFGVELLSSAALTGVVAFCVRSEAREGVAAIVFMSCAAICHELNKCILKIYP